MKKKYLFLSLIAAMVMALGAKAQEETYNMIIKMADGTTVFINPHDVDSISFNNGAVSISGSNVDRLVQIIQESQDRTTRLEQYMAVCWERTSMLEANMADCRDRTATLEQNMLDCMTRTAMLEQNMLDCKEMTYMLEAYMKGNFDQLYETMEVNSMRIKGDAQIINPETDEPYTFYGYDSESGWGEYPLTMGRIAANLSDLEPMIYKLEDEVMELREMTDEFHYRLADFLECSPWSASEKLVKFLSDLKSRLDALDGGGGDH